MKKGFGQLLWKPEYEKQRNISSWYCRKGLQYLGICLNRKPPPPLPCQTWKHMDSTLRRSNSVNKRGTCQTGRPVI